MCLILSNGIMKMVSNFPPQNDSDTRKLHLVLWQSGSLAVNVPVDFPIQLSHTVRLECQQDNLYFFILSDTVTSEECVLIFVVLPGKGTHY